jgi:hypothetical protein
MERHAVTIDEALELARRHGVRVALSDNNLFLEADTAPPADVVAPLKADKPTIVGELRLRHALERQRREEVERRDITRWINNHFIASPPGRCVHCWGGSRANDRFVLIFVGSDRADVHASCHQTWLAERQATARRALGLEARPLIAIGQPSSSTTVRDDALMSKEI